jgi:hypothetical protein
MEEKKKIQINSEYLMLNGGQKSQKKSAKKQAKIKSQVMNVNNASVKELLLQKLKAYRKQKKENEKTQFTQPQNHSVVSGDFIQKIKRKKNKTENVDLNPLQAVPKEIETTNHIIQLDGQSSNVKIVDETNNNIQIDNISSQAPQYSNLKNSSLPTYRQWKRQTQKSYTPQPSKKKLKHTKFTFGKNKTVKKVGILLKSNVMKEKVNESIISWKKNNMKTVKNYLKDKNLIRYGTNAPNELLREMYLSSNLCGNVENTNGQALIDNYMENN